MELFDTHFHLGKDCSAAEIMEKISADLTLNAGFFNAPVSRLLLMCAGDSFSGSLEAQKFAAAVPDGYYSVGVHPHNADKYLENKEDFAIFRNDPKLRAIGEIGLDYFYDLADRESQKKVLSEFLALALEWDLPAMLHLRDKENCFDAYSDAYTLLKPFAGKGGRFVIHCYAGDAEFAEKFLELGGYFGVTGMYTFRAAENIRSALKDVPLENLLIETDSPYLAPVPFRGRENTPGMVTLVAVKLGADRNLTPEKAAQIFSDNGKRFYNIV